MHSVKIDPEFKALIPPLSEEEYSQLEENIIKDGCRDAVVTWNGVIIDGHNRYNICTENDIDFNTVEMDFADRADVIIWIINNQFGRRNIIPYIRGRLALRLKDEIAKKAKENQGRRNDLIPELPEDSNILANSPKGCDAEPEKKGLANSPKDLPDEKPKPAPINTRQEVAKAAGIGDNTLGRIEKIEKLADDSTKKKLETGEISINQAYNDIRREEKRKEVIEKLESIEAKEVKASEGVYDVIVIDPPWAMQKIERDCAPEQVAFEYPTMSEEELNELKVPCADDCHVWLWTTHKFLPMAFRLLEKWGLKYVCCFTWHKNGGFQPFGLPQYNCEFAIYARRGTPSFIDTKNFPTCFDAKRGRHSEKPEEFYDIVRRVTAGRRLDMFNRRSIDGFDVWGNES